MDIFQKSITPDKPRVLAEEQIYVYVPMATSTNAGIASYNRDQFDIIGSEVSLKWPAESFAQGPIETPSIVKVLDNEFEYTGNLVDLISGNSKISSDKLEVQLKRILRDAYERPELVMLDPNYFVRTIVEKDGKQYYKYNTTAIHYNMSQNLSEDEQAQARQNISASSVSDNEATNKRIDALLQTGVYSINGKTGNVVLKNSDLENDTNYATEQYVQENGGKIDKIVLNDNEQEIINKIVTLTIDKTTVGLSNVDNTSDKNKPISDAAKQALDTKMDKSGGIFTGNVGVQGNLSVSGTITTKDTETLKVQDNVIVTNANKIDLLDLSGLAINKNDTQTYGIMYDVVDDSVKLGLGSIDSAGKFTFNEGEGSPIATRSDSSSLTDNHLIKWDATNNKLVDSGYSAEDKLDKIINTDTYNRVYGINSDGTQTTYNVSVQPEKDSIVCRDYYGRIGSKSFYANYISNFENWDTNSERRTRITLEPKSFEMVSCIGSQYSGLTFTNDTDTNSNDMSIFGEFMGSKTTPDYAKQIGFSMNYNNVSYLENGITLRVLENLQNGKILSLTQNGLFIGDGFDAIPEGEQTLPLKNKKEISPNTIRYDIKQTLTDEQKAQARANIDASSISDNDAINNRIDAYELQVEANTAARHVHNNKTLLDTYTQTEANLADAVNKKHIHSNKEILDGITASYTTEEKAKLNGIASGAEVNIQADWAQTDSSSKDYIKNKPLIPEGVKLYSSTGENTDGAMTQKAVTDEFKNNVSIQFAESERQKSKNLFDLNYSGTFNSKIETSLSNFISMKSVYGEKFSINTDLPNYSFTRGSVGDIYTNIIFKNLKPNTSYIVSFTPISISSEANVHFLGVYNIQEKLNTRVTKSFTTDENGTFNTGYGIWINAQNTTFVVSNIQLEEGSVATDYQPYNGAIVHDKQLNEQLSNYLPLSGGTMTGQLKLAPDGLITNANDGYSTDKWGNLNTLSSDAGALFKINSYDKSKSLTYAWNTGVLTLPSIPKVNNVNVALTSDIPDLSSYVTKDSSNIINNVDGMRGRLFGNDTRSVNGAPSTYQNQSLSKSMGIEFKSSDTISVPNSNEKGYVILQTINPWGDASGGLPSQLSYGNGLAYRTASSSSAWNSWRSIIDSTGGTISGALTITGSLSLTSVPKVNDVNVALTSDIPNLLNKVYPVGSIYMSTKNNSPASFLGGTWLQLKDTFLLAHGDTYTSTKSATDSQVTSEGGEATHTLTIAEMPSHDHKTTLNYSGNSGPAGVYGSRNKDTRTYTSTSTGGSSAHNNMPPYLVVYMWKRTA